MQTARELAICSRKESVARERTTLLSCDQAVEAETLSGAGDEKEALHEDQKDVEPGPFLGLTVEAEPKVGHEQHAHHGHGPHEKAEDEAHRERQLGQIDQRIEHRKQLQEDVLGDPAVELERGILGDRAGRRRESAGDRERQLPDRALIEHDPDHDAHEPGGEVLLRALRGVAAPVGPGDPDAGSEQCQEQRGQQPADAARPMLVGVAGQKEPCIDKRVGAHQRPPNARMCERPSMRAASYWHQPPPRVRISVKSC
jgi:hypothetical protein